MELDLNELLKSEFSAWKPAAPIVKSRSKSSITLAWQSTDPFSFLEGHLIYTLEKKEKIPTWITVYSGGRNWRTIENLAPRHPHKFRLQATLTASGVESLAERAVQHYGSSDAVLRKLKEMGNNIENETAGDHAKVDGRRWVRSRCSDDTCSSTDTDGSSALCFCVAVRCGYMKQLQAMLEERPELVNIPAPNGFTPLATAVRKGDANIVRFLVQAGADVNLAVSAGRTALHLAAQQARALLVNVLLDCGADLQARDVNGMRAEHHAVDSGDTATVTLLLDRGGDLDVRDTNGWTPLFRAVCQGASTEMIEQLVARGSCVHVVDRAGLALLDAARILRDEKGRRRHCVLRCVDAAYPRQAAHAHFARLTKKISSVHSLLK